MKHKLELTKERGEIIAQTYHEWHGTGFSTEPACFEVAEQAITALYARLGKPRPYFVRLSSPLAAELYINLLCKTWPVMAKRNQLWNQLRDQLGNQLRNQLRDQLGNQLWNQLRNQLRNQLGDQLGDQLRNQLWNQLRDQLGDQLGDQLRNQLWNQLRDQLGNQLRNQLRDQLGNQLWNQLRNQLGDQLGDQLRNQLWNQLRNQLRNQLGDHDLKYMGTYFWGAWDYLWMWLDVGRRVGAVYSKELDIALTHHVAICRSIGWWYPFEDFCIITDRPSAIRIDDAGRLHSPNRMAMEYRDGTGLHAWHGTRAPAEWFEGKLPTASQALQWSNAEHRRVACEMLGWAKILRELNAKEIDRHVNPMIGTLVEATLPENGPQRFLRVMCGTGREFALCVPNHVKTAIEAQSLIQRIPPEMVERIEVRT